MVGVISGIIAEPKMGYGLLLTCSGSMPMPAVASRWQVLPSAFLWMVQAS
jgi:hypothetical protein